MPEDIQQRVLQAFQEEHREHLAGIREIFAGWPALAPEALDDAFRMAHSLKGGARVCGLSVVEQLAHHLEHLVEGLVKDGSAAHPETQGEVGGILAAIEDYMAALAQQRVPEVPAALLERLGIRQAPSATTAAPTADEPVAPPESPANGPSARSAGTDSLRISASRLDRLLQSSSQLLAETMRQDTVGAELREILEDVVAIYRRAESREDGGNDAWRSESPIQEVQRGLAALTRRLRRLRTLQQQGARSLRSLGQQLQSDVRSARMVPVSSVFEGFPKMVRDLAQSEGKQVEFSMNGFDAEADRLVLQALKDPLMHVLRNALSHGIELPEERERLGKTPAGRLEITVDVTGNQLVLAVEDDGRGLDLRAIRARAVSLGRLAADAELSEEETLSLVFQPGFSTATSVTSISGRGIGLFVVKEAANRLQGSARLEPRSPAGTRLQITTPVSVATHRVLLVESAGHTFAIPLRAILELCRVKTDEVRMVEGKATIWHRGEPVLMTSLAGALEMPDSTLAAERSSLRVVLLRVEDRLLAVGVDSFAGELDSLVQPLPFPASTSPFFSGGIILENGAPALVVNAASLLERFRGGTLEHRAEAPSEVLAPEKKSVLVVDDSFTARTLQKSILETEGYDVGIAVDGLQALAALRAGSFDVVVTDVQMPRMDGFELLEEIKRDPRLRNTPVILVTSLSSESDQAKGLALGAEAYIVKQRFDHRELIDVVRQMV